MMNVVVSEGAKKNNRRYEPLQGRASKQLIQPHVLGLAVGKPLYDPSAVLELFHLAEQEFLISEPSLGSMPIVITLVS